MIRASSFCLFGKEARASGTRLQVLLDFKGGPGVQLGSCNAILYNTELERNFSVNQKCEHHMRISARTRLNMFLDEGGHEEIGKNVKPVDPLNLKTVNR